MATITQTPTAATWARHNLGPLTVAFEAPAACSFNIAQCDTCTKAWRGQQCTGDGAFPVDDFACWPPTATYAPKTTPGFNGWGFYSPGTLCPTGYTPSCTKTDGLDGGFPFQYDLVNSETAIGCCPTGFSCTLDQNEKQTCVTVAVSTSIATATCPGQGSGQPSILRWKTLPSVVPTSTMSDGAIAPGSTINNFTVFAPLFQLIHQPSDLTTAGAGTIASNGISIPAASATSNQTSSDQSTSGLSTGAAVGIGIGAAAGLAGMLVLTYFAWRSKRRREIPSTPEGAHGSRTYTPWTGHHEPQQPNAQSELSSNNSKTPHESPSNIEPSELEGSSNIQSPKDSPNTQNHLEKSLMTIKNMP
ncbi:hypothetical protein BJ166DRAFT_572976 [Pestalotiopsis sp. NC0098]|nr:hypothetical protein BJ166DRAFT_572976 [Pestalotiopsis sp. NC0098]